jgi:hypothetical protein
MRSFMKGYRKWHSGRRRIPRQAHTSRQGLPNPEPSCPVIINDFSAPKVLTPAAFLYIIIWL